MALLDDYKKFLRGQGKSENTIKTYSGHVNEYYRWYMDTFGEAPTLLYHTNILDFRSYLQNIKKLKFKSIDTKLSSLTSFNEFLVQIGVQKDLVITAEDRLKFQQEIASPTEIEKKDVEAFLQKVLVDTGKRNYAIAVILAYAGLRVSECISIGLTDIDFQAREGAVREGGSKSFVICFSSSDTMPERSLAEPHRTRPFHNPGILDLSTFYVPENNQKYNADPDAYSEKMPGCYRRDERNCKVHIHCILSFLSYSITSLFYSDCLST